MSGSTEKATRAIDLAVEIDAAVKAVWRALTDAEELKNWFPLDARVNPGPGGSMFLSCGPAMAGEVPVAVWEPNRRLQWTEGVKVVDFFLVTRGGRTVLRLVHSGFATGKEWDDEYELVQCGWHFELRSLRHYLEQHGGTKRHAVWACRRISGWRPEAWARLLGLAGLGGEGSFNSLREGTAYAATGDRFAGKVLTFFPERQFGATVENLNNALLRVELEPHTAYVWLSAFGLPKDKVEAFRDRWLQHLAKLFPEEIAAEETRGD